MQATRGNGTGFSHVDGPQAGKAMVWYVRCSLVTVSGNKLGSAVGAGSDPVDPV